MSTEVQECIHLGQHFTNATVVIEKLTLPVVLDRIRRGDLRVYRIPGVRGKFFRTKQIERP